MLHIKYLFLALTGVIASPLAARDDLTATVDLSKTRGDPQNVASGFIYGIPDNYPNQIPDHWYTDIGFRYARTGGAQLGAPSRGWLWGEFEGRLQYSYIAQQLMACAGANSSTLWPGDNGNWVDFDKYLATLLDALVDNDMLDGLVIDIWNEPELSVFWQRSLQQYVDLYIRTHKTIRADSRFKNVKISGPSMATAPVNTNVWWTTWLSQIAGNNTVPDQWSYHLERGVSDVTNDPQYTNASLAGLLKTHGLPEREVNINEYAVFDEMHPSGYVWWIARLERYNFLGLLGNWLSGSTLHDLFANLITKTRNPYSYAATDYVAAPGYWVYRYYATNMTGERLSTTGSTDNLLDVYATKDDSTVRLLVGSRVASGTWSVSVTGLSAIGYGTSGSVSINTWGFDGTDAFAPQAAPSFRNTVSHTFTDNTLTFPIYQTDTTTAWAFEFSVK
ncbi:glycoside hydrolase family 39 protein [Truncatella angustata]|uniref:Glycoside hydrolase family 39 protein n=1 Tax=Truncatella angustata TaxID=152316 RepID=A0A9P8RQT2_9PEZI|nr:glycoside hydrolase family 39 protein [Truncatella angustata]KAH6647772.1 glycoside hydrolase family 39 protein [Truncatella angustata]